MSMDLKEYIQTRLKANQFIQHLGMELIDLGKGEAEVALDIKEFHLQQNGFMHGGVTASLADVATGIAAYTLVPEGKNVVTADLKISYLNPGTAARVKARGRVIKGGNLLYFCEAEIFDLLPGEEKLIASATAIMIAVDIPLKES
jgi:uncharacterized protein (TIGR00369 family)